MRFASKFLASAVAAIVFAGSAPAMASDEDLEIWLNPRIEYGLDDDTSIELETGQRFRDANNGRADTYYFRLWLNRNVADNVEISGGVEKGYNTPGRDELRFLEQVQTKHGIVRTRFRLEQRFSEGRGGRMGLRVRPRLGVSIPLNDDKTWDFGTNVELFWTLRGTSPTSDTGLTRVRTQIGVGHDLTDNLEVSLAYLFQRDFEDNAPDQVAHVPLIGMKYSF